MFLKISEEQEKVFFPNPFVQQEEGLLTVPITECLRPKKVFMPLPEKMPFPKSILSLIQSVSY